MPTQAWDMAPKVFSNRRFRTADDFSRLRRIGPHLHADSSRTMHQKSFDAASSGLTKAFRVTRRSTKTEAPKDTGTSSSSLLRLTEQIAIQEEVLRQGGGPAGRERQRKLGRLTARQRLEKLLDPGAPFTEIALWAAYEMYPDAGEVPAAGVITGIGRVSGRSCMLVANDATVKAGAFFPATVKKVLRAQKIAVRCNLPLVYLVDSAGVYLPMQDEIFPDEDDFGRIFRNNAVLSAMGVPQYSAVMGNCVAGGAYLPVLSDKLLMTSGSAMYLAGPALVKAAIGEIDNDEELGGAAMHAEMSGTVDFHEPDDESCLKRLRSLIELLPQLPSDVLADNRTKPARDPHDLYQIVSGDGRADYDVRDLLACIVDDGTLQEYKASYGKTLVCAYASLGGRPTGIVASQRRWSNQATAPRSAASSTMTAPTRPPGLSWTAPRRICQSCSSRTFRVSWSAGTPSSAASSAAAQSW